MLSSLLRTKRGRRRVPERSPFSSPMQNGPDSSSPLLPKRQIRHAAADFTETEDSITHSEEDEDANNGRGREDGEPDEFDDDDGEDGEEEEEEDGEDDDQPLLPIFSAAHLDSIPVYSLTHAIRLIVLQRCETSLTFDQLRSPQVTQFLVKPMQQKILSSHFSRATLYALLANCLQFSKEMSANPGMSGVSKTRAMVCELLAIKLLKEYNTRELIDALSYDFFPLQGLSSAPSSQIPIRGGNYSLRGQTAARVSAFEVAIRAQAKKFLAHPLVVQQLEAIWAGTIVFHSASDDLHRFQAPRVHKSLSPRDMTESRATGYGTTEHRRASTPPSKLNPSKQRNMVQPAVSQSRRRVTIYDPRDASLFKLSRLRVPRYRQFLSTMSLAILLCLLVTVLANRSAEITALEIVFWFWSAGFMLDELVGFNDQGFSLYVMSFWNIFDATILLCLMVYYGMRLYGLFLPDIGRIQWDSMAYDVLAATAVVLFPRLFSVLDHYRYFSQLLIALRLMLVDLVAVFVLVFICCSGFFAAFTLSFGRNQYHPAAVAFDLFKLLMGFTPTAWDAWPQYNILGKSLLVAFMFVTHFLIITILITVLTNSLMAITNNANEEHQFLFAVNTISMVKNDALFSYVAPSNIFAWVLAPLRYFVPFRQFVRINRTVIKVTHAPLLFSIFAYERLILARRVFDSTDLVVNRGRGRHRFISFQDPIGHGGLFSPGGGGGRNFRQESIAAFHKDRALDEVFRLAPDRIKLRAARKTTDRTETSHVVNNWIEQHEGIASPPPEQDPAIVDRLEAGRYRKITANDQRFRRLSAGLSGARSVASDPEEFGSTVWGTRGNGKSWFTRTTSNLPRVIHHATDQEEEEQGNNGDDELATQDEDFGDENATLDKRSSSHQTQSRADNQNQDSDIENESEDYFSTPTAAKHGTPFPGAQKDSSTNNLGSQRHNSQGVARLTPPKKLSKSSHTRNTSTATILYNPVNDSVAVGESSAGTSFPKFDSKSHQQYAFQNATARNTPTGSGSTTPVGPRRSVYAVARDNQPQTSSSKPRPIMPSRTQLHTAPNRAALLGLAGPPPGSTARPRPQAVRHRRSSMDMIADITSEMGFADGNQNLAGGLSTSFRTQMWEMQQGNKGKAKKKTAEDEEDEEQGGRIMGRLMLARMQTLEEGFRDVVREVKGMRKIGTANTSAAGTVANYSPGEGVSSAGGGSRRLSSGSGVMLKKPKVEMSSKKREKERKRADAKGGSIGKSTLTGQVRLEDWGLEDSPAAKGKGKGKEIEGSDKQLPGANAVAHGSNEAEAEDAAVVGGGDGGEDVNTQAKRMERPDDGAEDDTQGGGGDTQKIREFGGDSQFDTKEAGGEGTLGQGKENRSLAPLGKSV